MQLVDDARISKLIDLSKKNRGSIYERFDWPESVKLDRLWCDEDLLTTFGTSHHDNLSERQKIELSKWEAINFYSLNVHGIKGVLSFVSQCLYERNYEDVTQYLHIFMAEENDHMWFFAKFCLDYANTIYPDVAISEASGQRSLETDFEMFVATMVFEEFVDFYNHKVGKNEHVPDIVRDINFQHHLDESRHVAFGRDLICRLHAEILDQSDNPEAARARLSDRVKETIRHFARLMYSTRAYQDAGIYEPLGFSSAFKLRNALLNDDARMKMHVTWFQRTAGYFAKRGILNDTDFLSQNV